MDDFSVYGLIMAGGKGRRLWPLSTSSRPKQFVRVGGISLIRRTFDRIRPFIGSNRLLVVTNRGKKDLVSGELPAIPTDNVIEEPRGKNTAPCIGLAAVYSQQVLGLDPEQSVMVVLPSDHLVTKEEKFRGMLRRAVEVARQNKSLVTLGIEPTRPATGYGYIEAAEPLPGQQEAMTVESFKEKPDRATAQRFLEAGNYYWNSGTFIWRTDQLLAGIREHLPRLYKGLMDLQPHLGTPRQDSALREVYESFPSVSIDYGLMEEAENRAVLPASFGWSDLGDWPSLEVLLKEDERGNSFEGEVTIQGSDDNLVYNDEDRPVVVLGLSDTVVVNTPEAVLVMDKSRSQQVKEVAKELEEKKEE